MRILHITPSYLPATRYGGPIYSVHNLCVSLVALGHDVHVYTTSVNGDANSPVPHDKLVEIDGVKVWYYPSNILRRIYYAPDMMKAMKAYAGNFDIMHGHSLYLWPTWASARTALKNHQPYLLSPRGMLVKELVQRRNRWIKMIWLKMIEKHNIEGAAGLHVTSATEEQALDNFIFRFPPIYQIPNGVNGPVAHTSEVVSNDIKKIVDGGQYVLYFGRINWEKGLDRLIRSWCDVPNWKLVIAGNDDGGYLNSLVNIARDSAVYDRVHFLPRSISGVDKEALLKAASLLVLPSYSENFGIVTLEAMVRAVPVVVTEEVGAKDVVKEARGGIVVTAGQLAMAINDLLSDPERRDAMGKHASQWVSSNMTWDIVARQMETVYQVILDNASRHHA